MSKLKIILAVGILAIVAGGVFVTRPHVTQAPSDLPAPAEDNRTKFNTPITIHVGESVMFTDGLSLRLVVIGDSRCQANVQCIWQGELSPIFRAESEPFDPQKEIFLGTVRTTSVAKYGYTFVLQSATEDTATIVVTYEKPDVVIKNQTVGSVAGHVTIGPICPVESIEHPCQVSPKVYTSREVVVYQGNGTTIKERVNLDEQGNYKISLSPGKYFIQIQPAGIGPGEKKLVTITASQTATINFDIDTGIR